MITTAEIRQIIAFSSWSFLFRLQPHLDDSIRFDLIEEDLIQFSSNKSEQALKNFLL